MNIVILFIRTVIVLIAIMSLYSMCAALINQTNPYLALAMLATALFALADDLHQEYVHDCARAAGRAGVWGRRDREAGGR